MTRGGRASALALALLSVIGGRSPAAAADDADVVELQVRTDRTLTDPGAPVAAARAAPASAGQSPADLLGIGAAADASGRIRLPAGARGATVLVWAPGFAPSALRADGMGPRIVTLERTPPFEVRVFGSGGSPEGGARVEVEADLPVVGADPGEASEHRAVWRAAADDRGIARFTGLPLVALAVTASAPESVDATRFPVDVRTGSVSLVLGRGARIGGTLRLLPGLVVPRTAVASIGNRTATLDAEGRFRIDGVPPGPCTLHVRGTGFAQPAPLDLFVVEGRDRTDLIVEAWRTSALVGTAHSRTDDGAPRRPLRAVRVEIAGPATLGRPPAVFDVACDAEGRFRIGDVAPADGVAVRVSAAGHVASDLPPVSFPPGADALPVAVVLERAGALTGRLADADGEALPGARVVARRATDAVAGPDVAVASTDASGAFRLDGLPAGPSVVVVTPRGAAEPARFGPWEVAEDGVAEVGHLRVVGGFALAGRIVGGPADVRVVVLRGGREVAAPELHDGAFELRGLAPGDVEVRALRGTDVGASELVTLPAGWPLALVWRGPAELRVRLVGDDDLPVADARVRLTPRTGGAAGRTFDVREADGRFTAAVPRLRWRIDASDARGRTGSAEIDLSAAEDPAAAPPEAEVRLVPGAEVRARVVDGTTGRPLEGASVTATPVDAAADAAGPSGVVDDLGTVALRGVPPGVWTFTVVAPGHPVHRTGPFAIRAGDAPDLGRIEVDGGLTIEGELLGGGRVAPAGVRVELSSDEGTRRTATGDRSGRFVLAGVEPGWATLSLTTPDGSLDEERRVLVPDVPYVWRLVIDAGARGSVAGRVVHGGRDVPFARVAARGGRGASVRVSAAADAFGRYLLEGLPAGPAEFEVRGAGQEEPWRVVLPVDGARGQELDLRLPEERVEGRVRSRLGGEPVRGARIALLAAGDPHPAGSARSREDGSFTVPHVPPGSYTLVAAHPGFGSVRIGGIVMGVGAVLDPIDVELPPEATVALRLMDERLRPVTDGWVEARAVATGDGGGAADGFVEHLDTLRASADGAGRVVVRGLARGPWRLTAGGGTFGRRDLGIVRVDEGPEELGETVLSAGGGLDVVAFRAGWGGAGGVRIEVRDALGRDPRPARRPDDALGRPDPLHTTDARGRLRLAGLAPGSYRVWAAVADGEAGAQRILVREESVVRLYVLVP